jgi:phage I-like protein
MKSDYLVDEFVNVIPGDPFRLFPFGRIVKDGKVREVTPELAKLFELPHWRPAIKLGTHEDDAPAGGFIVGLEVREDGLYALPEWNDEGAAAMSRGAFRYHSPEVAWSGGFENPETGDVSNAPTIVGDALLHMPHLGEATALYSVEQVIEPNGGISMTEETMTVSVGLIDRLLAWRVPAPEPQGEDYAVKYQAEVEQVELLQAQIGEMEAQAQRDERIAHFAAELPDEEAEIHVMLVGMPEEQADKLTARLKALTEQAKAGNLEQDIGASGEANGTGDPVAAFDAAVKARMEADELGYPQAVNAVIADQPDLYEAYQRGGN